MLERGIRPDPLHCSALPQSPATATNTNLKTRGTKPLFLICLGSKRHLRIAATGTQGWGHPRWVTEVCRVCAPCPAPPRPPCPMGKLCSKPLVPAAGPRAPFHGAHSHGTSPTQLLNRAAVQKPLVAVARAARLDGGQPGGDQRCTRPLLSRSNHPAQTQPCKSTANLPRYRCELSAAIHAGQSPGFCPITAWF